MILLVGCIMTFGAEPRITILAFIFTGQRMYGHMTLQQWELFKSVE